MTLMSIPVTKAKRPIEIDTDLLPENVFLLAVQEGLKVLLNRKMSKITTTGLSGEELTKAQDAAMVIAESNREDCLNGKVSAGRGAAKAKSGVSREVTAEAMRLARNAIRTELKSANIRPSMVEAKEITALAKDLIASDPSYLAEAIENIETRAPKKREIKGISAILAESPKLTARVKKPSAGTLSAAKAGKVAPRKSEARLN